MVPRAPRVLRASRVLRALRSVALFAPLAIAACSSNQGALPGPTGTTGGASSPADVAGDTNPEGVAYPTAHLGPRARGIGAGGAPNKTPGNVFPNLKFMGYPDGDPTKGLQPISLASFYDPDGLRYRVLHITYSDGWCPDCKNEVAALTQALHDPSVDYRKKGVVYLEAVGEGVQQNVGATQADLDQWVHSHPSLFAEVLDPLARQLGAFFDTSTVPFNANIDTRTMEILSSGTGYEDPASVTVWIDWAETNPPMVP